MSSSGNVAGLLADGTRCAAVLAVPATVRAHPPTAGITAHATRTAAKTGGEYLQSITDIVSLPAPHRRQARATPPAANAAAALFTSY
jgi:hypothetical protein